MGIHPHTVMFLKFASVRMPLGRVATMGRQGMFVSSAKMRAIIGAAPRADYGEYCEHFLMSELGASHVHSFDISDFEGATHVCDFNHTVAIQERYDTILDGGFLEHIFNVPQALENMSTLCATGGQILHVLPANNVCGHGFWQFTPELFFALYCAENGYADTQVFLADVANEKDWYEVNPPATGAGVVIVSSGPVWLLARTVRARQFSHSNVQQTFYVNLWDKTHSHGRAAPAGPKGRPGGPRAFTEMARYAERKWQEVLRPGLSLSSANSNLQKRATASLVKSPE
jgi:hypothetical protein